MSPLYLTGIVFSVAVLAACATTPATQHVNTADARIAWSSQGNGQPVVVLQSGLGDDRSVWSKVTPALSTRYTVFNYDRPGYGASSSTHQPRDACTIATELHSALRDAGIAPPYLLVGHSIGGLYQYAFARLYPKDTAGLVLLDPTHPDHWRHMQADVPSLAMLMNGMRATTFTPAMRQEFDDQQKCLDQLPQQPALTMPVRLLVHTQYSVIERGAFETMMHEQEKDWLRLTGAPSIDAIQASGHYIQKEQASRVIEAVDSVSAAIGTTAK